MKCIRCGAWTRVLETRAEGQHEIRRRRRCANECEPFWTHEVIATAYTPGRAAAKAALRTVERRILLWKRDQYILAQLALGRSGDDIAAELDISPSTVSLVKRKGGKPS